MEGGATFSNNDNVTIDSGHIPIGRAQYKVVYQDNRSDKKVRFGAKATAGIAREQFKSRVSQSGGGISGVSRGQNVWTLGARTFVDFGECRRRFRVGAEYYRSFYTKQSTLFPEISDKHNFELSAGILYSNLARLLWEY